MFDSHMHFSPLFSYFLLLQPSVFEEVTIRLLQMVISYSYYSIRRSRIINVQLVVLFLLLATADQERSLAQGRSMFMQRELNKEDEGDGMVKESFMIGSTPPQCRGICLNCGPCEAVQVPATPQDTKASVNANGRGDESSNYKPINWKCKCGNFFFNP